MAQAIWADKLFVDMFFDFRVVNGDLAEIRTLEDYAFARAKDALGFLRQLASVASDLFRPFGMFGNISTKYLRANMFS